MDGVYQPLFGKKQVEDASNALNQMKNVVENKLQSLSLPKVNLPKYNVVPQVKQLNGVLEDNKSIILIVFIILILIVLGYIIYNQQKQMKTLKLVKKKLMRK